MEQSELMTQWKELQKESPDSYQFILKAYYFLIGFTHVHPNKHIDTFISFLEKEIEGTEQQYRIYTVHFPFKQSLKELHELMNTLLTLEIQLSKKEVNKFLVNIFIEISSKILKILNEECLPYLIQHIPETNLIDPDSLIIQLEKEGIEIPYIEDENQKS